MFGSFRNWCRNDPVGDAEEYASRLYNDRANEVLCYCDSCGGPIYGDGSIFEDEEYWCDEEGVSVHMRLGCMISRIREKNQSFGGFRYGS